MKLTLVCTSLVLAFSASAQNLELKRVCLSSSGVGYFEHEAQVSGKSPMRGRIVSVLPIAATGKDPVLREQINKALTALSNNRAKDARSLDIISERKGSRTVRAGYVTTVPIWKNAYRFTMPSPLQKDDTKAQIQGWAVIENMSGQDWTNVQLTLTAGKPVKY